MPSLETLEETKRNSAHCIASPQKPTCQRRCSIPITTLQLTNDCSAPNRDDSDRWRWFSNPSVTLQTSEKLQLTLDRDDSDSNDTLAPIHDALALIAMLQFRSGRFNSRSPAMLELQSRCFSSRSLVTLHPL
nr:hypothetical protein CFP56_74221 [Quercus suber]